MKWAAIAAAAIAAATFFGAACSYQDSTGNTKTIFDRSVEPHYVNLPEGGRVLCIWESGGYSGGLSCDWQGAKR